MIVGVDFGAPQRARDQRRKIIAIAAQATAWRSYRIDAAGMNARLLANDPPGWSAKELLDELLALPARVVAFDFPFCVPHALLRDAKFAADVGIKDGAFTSWRSFNWFVAQRLPLDFSPFTAWRDRNERARLWMKRATDIATGGQPPLKDKFQATFQMTLLGNALLSKLWESHKYRVLPFPGGRGAGEIIEVYPGATLRTMGLASYKSRPDEAVRCGIAACAAAGIKLDVDLRLVALCCRYSSGGRTPDYDVADAFVALCTAILHAEGACRPAIASDPTWARAALEGMGGSHLGPDHRHQRAGVAP
ncbi:hypothetical protein BE04_43140 [Sorangium cellulosum]|uniref:DUF429 domain-containing protein n=1 Tax=Sorangium cellulosum TaxID=56 RepID=A0A150PJQ1_SORCE|nr:hypothetical protein BE04_43140 [Sorangium cellulosum]